jgi:hypothetical protein
MFRSNTQSQRGHPKAVRRRISMLPAPAPPPPPPTRPRPMLLVVARRAQTPSANRPAPQPPPPPPTPTIRQRLDAGGGGRHAGTIDAAAGRRSRTRARSAGLGAKPATRRVLLWSGGSDHDGIVGDATTQQTDRSGPRAAAHGRDKGLQVRGRAVGARDGRADAWRSNALAERRRLLANALTRCHRHDGVYKPINGLRTGRLEARAAESSFRPAALLAERACAATTHGPSRVAPPCPPARDPSSRGPVCTCGVVRGRRWACGPPAVRRRHGGGDRCSGACL